jgi:dienelactone hydrolase
MGSVILVVAFLIEVAFATYCIVTKSYQRQVRSIVRVAAFAAFALVTLAAVIEWGARWYALATLLLVWALLGAWALLGRRAEKREYRVRRTLLTAIGMLLFLLIAITPALIFPQHEPLATTGADEVGTVNYTYTDPSRIETFTNTGANRKLNVELWYPRAAEGRYPFIVFSHGSTGVRTSNLSMYRELASHGYVVASIDHTYHALFTTSVEGATTMINMGYLQELQAEDARANRQQSFELYQKWMKLRTDDINFVIDHVLAQAKEPDAEPVYKLVDAKHIGVAGHSLGGSAALGIGRIRDDVGAVIALESPFMDPPHLASSITTPSARRPAQRAGIKPAHHATPPITATMPSNAYCMCPAFRTSVPCRIYNVPIAARRMPRTPNNHFISASWFTLQLWSTKRKRLRHDSPSRRSDTCPDRRRSAARLCHPLPARGTCAGQTPRASRSATGPRSAAQPAG